MYCLEVVLTHLIPALEKMGCDLSISVSLTPNSNGTGMTLVIESSTASDECLDLSPKRETECADVVSVGVNTNVGECGEKSTSPISRTTSNASLSELSDEDLEFSISDDETNETYSPHSENYSHDEVERKCKDAYIVGLTNQTYLSSDSTVDSLRCEAGVAKKKRSCTPEAISTPNQISSSSSSSSTTFLPPTRRPNESIESYRRRRAAASREFQTEMKQLERISEHQERNARRCGATKRRKITLSNRSKRVETIREGVAAEFAKNRVNLAEKEEMALEIAEDVREERQLMAIENRDNLKRAKMVERKMSSGSRNLRQEMNLAHVEAVREDARLVLMMTTGYRLDEL